MKIALFILCFTILMVIICFTPTIGDFPASPHATPYGVPLPTTNYQITAGYYDKAYYTIFHKQHLGIDLIPKPYILQKQVILHTTMDGVAYQYSEKCSGNAVIIINAQYIIYLGHIAKFLISNGMHVRYMQEVAVMGESGTFGVCVTGPHVHYQIYKKINGIFTIVDPTNYLK